jgi:outer membrane immunogenic protein
MKYKGFLLATAGGLAIVPGAQAADLLTKAPVMPAPSWTGWYIGANLGAAWQNMNNNSEKARLGHVDGSTLIGGGQIGYNWQHGSSVFGIEGDISGLSDPSNSVAGKSASTSTHWLSTIRGRWGLAVTDTMVYATGGVAFGEVENTIASNGGFVPNKSVTKTKVGWTVGGGVEHMWDAHWTIGLEGLFVDLGKSSVTPGTFTTKTTTFSNQLVIGRVKLNYKF